jgi:hypothetical protein
MVNLNRNFTVNLITHLSRVLIIICILLFSSCKRTLKDQEVFGPEYRAAPANFYVIGNSFTKSKSSAVNFNIDTISFHASFSDSVTWTITLSQASGAVKVITGLSKSINQYNAVWDCSSSNIYHFRRLEPVTAVLSFLGSDITLSTTVSIYNVFLYNNKTINGVKYLLIDDFDNGGPAARKLTGSTYKDLLDANVVYDFDSVYRVQGKFSYKFAGRDLNNNGYLAGMNMEPLTAMYNSPTTVTVTDPKALFLNVYIYGTGKANSSIEFKAYELDTLSDYSIPGYVYDQKENDGWVYDVIIDWTGWKLVHLRYSDFQRARDPLYGGAGNGIKEPNKITGYAVSLLSHPVTGGDVDLRFDYVILSENGVFDPK